MAQLLHNLKFAIIVLSAVGLLLTGRSGAADAPPVTDVQVEQWVKDLSSPSNAVRDQAEHQLLNSGEAALRYLAKQASADEATNVAVSRIRRALQTKLAEESVLGVARSGATRSESSDKDLRFSDSTDLAVVSRCVRIRPTIALVPSEIRDEPVLLRARVAVDVAANVRPLRMKVRDSQFHLDSAGTRFVPFSPDARREIACDEQTTQFTVNFLVDEDSVPDRCQMTGAVQLLCLGGVEPVEFSLTDKSDWIQAVGETEATLTSVECDADAGLRVTLMVTYPPGVKWESYQAEALHQQVWFRSGDNKPVKCLEVELIEVKGERHTIQCRFPQIHTLHSGDRLINSLPALIADIEIPFEIKNVPVAR
ncbi:hypothetical protein [Planctomicrobium sp. SH527]|uniref:hypothetical protein n=1 Tax=Planctomicrobium sp. SH527 TaxID=3448123 RepID=UPI003F5B41B0